MEAGKADVCLQLGLHGAQVASAQGPLTHLAVREGGHFWGTVLGKAKGNLWPRHQSCLGAEGQPLSRSAKLGLCGGCPAGVLAEWTFEMAELCLSLKDSVRLSKAA